MKTSSKLYALLAALALLVSLVVVVSFWAFRQIEDASDAKAHTDMVLDRAQVLLAELTDAETGQRGYTLTGDERFLQPYLMVRDHITPDLEALRLATLNNAAQDHLAKLAPLVDAKLAELAHVIALRRNHEIAAAIALVSKGEGQQLMESIRTELLSVIQIEKDTSARHEITFRSNMRNLFTAIVAASVLSLLLALLFVYWIYREQQHRLSHLVHLETQHLLASQQESNAKLTTVHAALLASEEQLGVTLNSMGDALIVTDSDARVTRMNPVAEHLSGWKQAEAVGRPVDEVFKIISKETRQPATIPVTATLAHGTVQGLANHTVLIARDGSECDIADSCAPMRDRDGKVIGAVLVFRNVSKEYIAQQALRDREALIQAILTTAADGIVTFRADGSMIEKVNPAAEQMFGYPVTELIGKNFSALIPELDRRNDALDYYSPSNEARASGFGREVSGRRKDGSSFPMEIAVSEMRLGGERYFTGILRDITARKQAEEALLKAGALQRAIFNSANFSSIATDARGVIQIFNVGAERMLGYAASDVMNKITPADISDPEEVILRAAALSTELGVAITPGFEALVFKASRGIEDIYELTYIRKDGTRFPAVVSVTALRDAEDAIIGYLLIGTDNTARQQVEADRKRLDLVLHEKSVELEKAKLIAEKANLAKSEFLSSMSHELRSPLNAILGFAQLMESSSPPPTPGQKSSIEQILKGGWYLLELINEVLDLSLIESGTQSLSTEPVSLAEVLADCEQMIASQAKDNGIRVTFPQFDQPFYVSADRTRAKQVFINLLSNAIKYNRIGGQVEVTCSVHSSNRIRVSFRDTGEGLPAEKIAQLFQPFNRLGQEVGTTQGTGIGLVVSKRLVELMHGEIGVQSTVGVGSVFWVELTATLAPVLDHHAHSPVVSAVLASSLPAGSYLHTLLYVEDNPANLMLVEQLVARRPDIRLLSATNGVHGIEIARASLPNVILMDINLPGISGTEALKILSDDPLTAHIPVIALSANAMPRDIVKGLEAGFFRYLTKPIKVQLFMETLDLALKLPDPDAQKHKEPL